MTITGPASAQQPLPSHVPLTCVEPFDFRGDADFAVDPHARLAGLAAKHRVFFTPFPRGLSGQGTWVFTHADEIRGILQDAERFRSGGLRPFAQVIGDNWTLIPVDLDPPEHQKYRTLLNPLFSPARMRLLDDRVNQRAAEMAAAVAGGDACEFITAFARPFPVSIFLELMGLPLGEISRFVAIEDAIIQGKGTAQIEGIRALRDYLAEQIAVRRALPTDDLISEVIAARIDDRPLTEGEVMGICFMLFIGGLDTVTSTLGFVFRFLAANPEQQAALRAEPDLVASAVEELLRLHNVVTTGRVAACDVEIAGVSIRAGDIIALPTSFASRSPAEFANPDQADFHRSPNRHSAFGYGIHRCVGSHLARRELIAAIRAWLRVIPAFRMADGAVVRAHGSGVVALDHLPLVWN